MTHREVCDHKASAMWALRPELLLFARKLVDADTAEDLVQEAFVRVMESGSADAVQDPLSYLKVVVRHLAFDCYTRKSRDTQVVERVRTRDCGLGGEPRSSAAREHSEELRERMSELSHRQWESLVMTVVLGMTEHEAASAVDVSRSAVTGSRERALQFLRDAVDRREQNRNRLAG